MQKLKVPRNIQWLIINGIIFLLIMTVLRLAFVLTFHNISYLSGLLPSFILGLRYDLRIVCIVAMLIFLFGLIKPLQPFHRTKGKRGAFILLITFSVILTLFYILDFSFYAYLSQRLTGSILNYAEDAKISMTMVWQTYPVIWLVLSLIGAVLLMSWFINATFEYMAAKPIGSTKKSRIGWGIAFFIALALGIFGRVGQYPLRWSDAAALGSDFKSQVAFNPFQSFFSTLNYRHSTYEVKKVKEHYNWIADFLGVQNPDINVLHYDRNISNAKNAGALQPNVVLVICESFSAYKSSMINNPLNTTPFFNQMVQQGIYFDRCFSPTYGTAKGVWAIVTGVPDVQLYNTASRNPSAVDQHTIINDFAGYEKYYFLGGSTSWANIRGLLTNNIKDLHLFEEGDYQAAKIDVWGISDKNLFLEANKTLANEKKPFFAIIQTADNHRPYTIPTEDKGAFKEVQLPYDTLSKYGFGSLEEYNAFRYTDFTFQQFMNAAKKENYFNNTIFVFVGDHGIYGNAGDLLPKAFTDLRLTSEHIPLLFYAPALISPVRFSSAVSQIDILPTVAGLAKINYTNSTLGRDLLNPEVQKKDAAFIIDVDFKKIGLISNNKFYSLTMDGGPDTFGNLLDNGSIPITDSLRLAYKKMTEGYYETARFMLLNNKKKGFY